MKVMYEINYYKEGNKKLSSITIYNEGELEQKIVELKDNPLINLILIYEVEYECYPSMNGEDFEFNIVNKTRISKWIRNNINNEKLHNIYYYGDNNKINLLIQNNDSFDEAYIENFKVDDFKRIMRITNYSIINVLNNASLENIKTTLTKNII